MTYQEALDEICQRYCEENIEPNDCQNKCICYDILQEAIRKAELYDKEKKS